MIFSIFGLRLRILRTTYKLSLAEFAALFGLKSTGAIADLEAGRHGPTFELFIRIANVFGVSLDWLAGRSESVYTLDSITMAEKSVLDIPLAFPDNYKEEYAVYFKSKDLSEDFPSFGVRANIAVLLRIVKAVDVYYFMDSQRGLADKIIFDSIRKLLKIPDLIELKKPTKKAMERNQALDQLLRQVKRKPAYDVEEAFQLMKQEKLDKQ